MERLSKDRLHTHYVRNEKCCVSAGGNSHRSGNDRQCGRKYAAVRTGRRPLWIFSEEGRASPRSLITEQSACTFFPVSFTRQQVWKPCTLSRMYCCRLYNSPAFRRNKVWKMKFILIYNSVSVRRATRLSPCDFKGFQRHLQSAYVLVRLIHLPWKPLKSLWVRSQSREEAYFPPFKALERRVQGRTRSESNDERGEICPSSTVLPSVHRR